MDEIVHVSCNKKSVHLITCQKEQKKIKSKLGDGGDGMQHLINHTSKYHVLIVAYVTFFQIIHIRIYYMDRECGHYNIKSEVNATYSAYVGIGSQNLLFRR